MAPYAVILLGAALTFSVSRIVSDAYEGQVTGKALTGLLLFQCIVAFIVLVFALSHDRILLLLILACWIPNLIVTSGIVTEFSGRFAVYSLFFPHYEKPVKNRLGRMKSLLWDENVEDAVKACLEEFESYPDESDILLDGATLLNDRGLYSEALKLLHRVRDTFPVDSTAWSLATYQAAVIYMERLDDGETARAMFRQLAERFPDKEIGMRARERMREQWHASLHDETDPWFHKTRQQEKKEVNNDDSTPPDPFYRKSTGRLQQHIDAPPSQPSRLEDEMPELFLDDEPPL